VDTYNQLLEKNPSNAEAWNNLGVCVQAMGRDDLSRQYFERAKDLKRYNKDKFRKRNLDSFV
jgi:Flp pilus assembly protein TadD